jgi:hypothetical protein
VNAATGNIAPASYAPRPSDPYAPPAVSAACGAQMKDALNYATTNAINAGKLGGYQDAWFNSNLAERDAARRIGVGNNLANSEKSMIPAMQDLAEQEVWRPPRVSGQVLKGAGGMLGAYSGRQMSSRRRPRTCSRPTVAATTPDSGPQRNPANLRRPEFVGAS